MARQYQLTFEDNKEWSAFYAPGPEIRSYLNHVVDKYALRPFIRLRHRITSATYHEGNGKWHLKVRRPAQGSPTEAGEHVMWDWETDFEEFDDTADVVLAGLGGLSRWSWPDIPGFDGFKGQVIHSAQWEANENGWQETVKDWGDKRVAVIGVVSNVNVNFRTEAPTVPGLVSDPDSPSTSTSRQTSIKLRPRKDLAFRSLCS